MQQFYVITGLGWGVADTPSEAVANYERIQRRNFPHLTDEDLKEAWGFVWKVPKGTTGFYHDWQNGLTWTTDGDETLAADPDDRIGSYGNVPESVRI